MDKKDVAALKKALGKTESTAIERVASCYVDVTGGDITLQEGKRFASIDDSDADQFLSFIKKGVSGVPGSTALEFEPETNALEPLRKTKLQDKQAIRDACALMKDTSVVEGDSWCAYFAYGTADLPGDLTYEFIIAMVQPCPMSKPGIAYDVPDSEFVGKARSRDLKAPVVSFLYPALDELEPDVSKAVCFLKSAKDKDDRSPLAEALFGVPLPVSAAEQKMAFRQMLSAGFGENIPFDAVKDAYEQIAAKKIDASVSGEDLAFTSRELADMVKDTMDGDNGEEVNAVDEAAEEYRNARFSADNIAPKTVTISSDHMAVKVDLNSMAEVKRMMIDGVDYYLIPAFGSSVDGIQVS